MSIRWVLSCEHGGNEIPPAYAPLFKEAQEILQTHRGWDPGALNLYKLLTPLADYSHHSTVSRLLVELNRSLHHPNLFSAYTKILPGKEKQQLLGMYYQPYRKAVQEAIHEFIEQQSTVVHLSIHSFTPVLHGDERKADIGLLYDPKRSLEKSVCQEWKALLQEHLPQFTIRYNYPYRGNADGFTTYLRKQFPNSYGGIELELNQRWANKQEVYEAIRDSLQALQQRVARRS